MQDSAKSRIFCEMDSDRIAENKRGPPIRDRPARERRWATLLAGLTLLLTAVRVPAQEGDTWRFVVGGDSRNCGDVVMPAVAAGARTAGASFYWHLGDFRAIYDFDQDLVAARRDAPSPLTISDYLRTAWDDFIESQLSPFGSIPVYLAIGNHETVSPKTRAEYLIQFADWLTAPPLSRQRLSDDPKDHRLKTYYHWIQNGVDFVTLDNATPEQFDAEQIGWFERVVKRDAADPAVRAIVVGMHASLPDSRAAGHSMSDTVQAEQTGRRVYADLLQAQAAGKRVYVLSSHSHSTWQIFSTPRIGRRTEAPSPVGSSGQRGRSGTRCPRAWRKESRPGRTSTDISSPLSRRTGRSASISGKSAAPTFRPRP